MTKENVSPKWANVSYVLKDKDGNIKPIWQEYTLLYWLRKRFGIDFPKLWFITGYWAKSAHYHNLITDAGKAAVAGLINGDGSVDIFDAIGIGTGTTAANASDTALETGVDEAGSADSGVHALGNADTTRSRVTTDVSNDTAQIVGTVTFTGSVAVTESGLFNADTNGTMLARQVFSVINVTSGNSLELTWKIDID